LDVCREPAVVRDGCTEIRFQFTSETGARVPCHLLLPADRPAPHPVIVCLQGHTTGMHISLGRPKSEADQRTVADGDRDFALQAVREGYAALVMEQRCFGERQDRRSAEFRHFTGGCQHASMVSLLLGRTMIGERVWDVSRAVDALAAFPEIDSGRIGCMGNSGGATITYFAACMDPRITIAMPSCYVCSFRHSIARIDHCADNYLPAFLRWFELGDIACLIAPRPMVVVAGQTDPIFPIAGVHEAYERIEAVYAAAGAGDKCRLVIGPGGHRFYASLAWPAFRELSGWSPA
ncbi:MAG TPA: alpha/beta hydrolase family protein, partial [Chthonomonadaceae bacterium]|nr:alpha/beta hydrolase family protein [Chthonomonadaceae bacterium]